MPKKKDKRTRSGAPAWMVTYSDMVTLLMIFFVLLMASGEVDVVKTRIILSAFEGKLGLLKGGKSLSPGDFENMGQSIESLPSSKRARFLSKSYEKAVTIFKPDIKAKKMRVFETERGIVISLLSDLLFEGGSAEVNFEDVRGILENVRLLMEDPDFQNRIQIEGHTDDVAYKSEDFRDNWELSIGRSWAVLNALRLIPSLAKFDENKVSIHGYGSTRPLNNNETPEGRVYNRRVDIVFSHENF